MKTCSQFILVLAAAVVVMGLSYFVLPSGATSLGGDGLPPGGSAAQSPQPESVTKHQIVKKYVEGCRSKPVKETDCDKLRKDTVEIVKEDLHTLGASANRAYLSTILRVFKSDEAELRIAAADAIGMIGPQDQDVDALTAVTNDPVPDVRSAVSRMISHGKGSAISLLAQRTISFQTGRAPDAPADAGKYALPVAPESTYLFLDSDVVAGRLSYLAKGMNEAAAFFRGKAKKGPLKLDEFREKYRYPLQDEEQAHDRAQEAAAKQLENVKPPDPTNAQAFQEYMKQLQSVQTGRTTKMHLDSYRSEFFGSPTVYVLEERQIGQRSYPTRYVVLYQDLALKRPGYRLSWMTVPDDAIKTAQSASLVEEKREEARKKEEEALKKRGEALDNLIKKKDEQEKSKFKKGQADLEKELGF